MSRNHKVRQQQNQNWVYIDIIQKAKHKAERYKKKNLMFSEKLKDQD